MPPPTTYRKVQQKLELQNEKNENFCDNFTIIFTFSYFESHPCLPVNTDSHLPPLTLHLQRGTALNMGTFLEKQKNNCGECPSGLELSGEKFCHHKSSLFEPYKIESKYRPRSVILDIGDEANGLYIIKSGLIKLEASSPNGSTITLRVAKTGQIFGYRAFFTNEPSYFRATALKETILCLIPKQNLSDLFSKYPRFAIKLIEHIASDLKEADRRWLSQFGDETHIRVNNVTKYLESHFPDQHWTKKEIAQMAGTTTETVFRTLSRTQRDN